MSVAAFARDNPHLVCGDYLGRLERIEGTVAVGWVVDRREPARPVTVALAIDERVVAVGLACHPRQDAYAAGLDHERCGFRLALPNGGVPLDGGMAAIRIANTNQVLAGSPQRIDGTAIDPPRKVRGDVNGTNQLTVRGWVFDALAPEERLTIDLVDDGTVVATARADRFRQDLLDAGIGDGAHGFEVTLPLRFADGETHRFDLVVQETAGVLRADGVTVGTMMPNLLTRRLLQTDPTGLGSTLAAVVRYLDHLAENRPASVPFRQYPAWKALFGCPPETPPSHIEGWRAVVLVVVAGDDPDALAHSLDSVAAQTWLTREVLVLNTTGQARAVERASRLHPSACVADLAAMPLKRWLDPYGLDATTALVPLLAGETLHPIALAHLLASLASGARAAYADYERETVEGLEPIFSPAWNETFFWHKHYIGPACALRGDGLALLADGDGAADLFFRVFESASTGEIRHIPHVLAMRPVRLCWPDEAAAVARHLHRAGQAAQVAAIPDRPELRTLAWTRQAGVPSVSLIIPTRDAVTLLRACIESLLTQTQHPAAEILVLDNGSTDPATHRYLAEISQHPGIRVLPCPGPFNYAAINNHAATVAKGALLAFINNDAVIPAGIGSDWLLRLAGHFARPEVGVVGIKLLYESGMVQHGGVVMGINGLADHAFRHAHADDPGYDDRLSVPHEVSAVTAALMVTRRDLFAALGGFDADRLPIAFNDVDYCLRVREAGYRVVFDPGVVAQHHESATRGSDVKRHRQGQAWREIDTMKRRWKAVIDDDPAYSPNLNLDDLPFAGLAFPPRVRRADR